MRWVWQLLERFRKFSNRRDPHLIEVKVVLTELGKSLFCRLIACVLKAACKQGLFKHRATGVGRNSLVVLLEHLLQFGELLGTCLC